MEVGTGRELWFVTDVSISSM